MQRLKKYIKKISAIGAGALLLGAGFGCVSNADHQSEMDTAVAEAKTEAMDKACGDMDIVDGRCITPEEEETEGCLLLVEQTQHADLIADIFEEDGIYLNAGLDITMDNYDLKTLLKYETEDEFEAEVEEKIEVETHLATAEDKDGYEGVPRVVVDKLNFIIDVEDDEIAIADIKPDNPVNLYVFGKLFKVVDAEVDSITFERPNMVEVEKGKCYKYGDKEIKILNIGINSIAVEVDGEVKIIKTKGTVSGVEISIDETYPELYSNDASKAYIRVGEDIRSTVKNGEYFTEDKEYENEYDSLFKWKIDNSDGFLGDIRVEAKDKFNDIDNDKGFGALKVGDSREFPFGYLTLNFGELVTPAVTTYTVGEIEDGRLTISGTDAESFVDTATGEEYMEIETDGVTIFGNDADLGVTTVTLGKSAYTLSVTGADVTITDGTNTVVVSTDYVDYLGLDYNTVDLTEKDGDYLTDSNIKFIDVEDNYDKGKGKVELEIPTRTKEKYEATISVKGTPLPEEVPKEPVVEEEVVEEILVEEE